MKNLTIVCVRDFRHPCADHLVNVFISRSDFYDWLVSSDFLIGSINIHLFGGTFHCSYVFDDLECVFIDNVIKVVDEYLQDAF